jgi:hypothetical protein
VRQGAALIKGCRGQHVRLLRGSWRGVATTLVWHPPMLRVSRLVAHENGILRTSPTRTMRAQIIINVSFIERPVLPCLSYVTIQAA